MTTVERSNANPTVRTIQQIDLISSAGRLTKPNGTPSLPIKGTHTWNRACKEVIVGFTVYPWLKLSFHSPREGYPSCLHATAASLLSQLWLQIVPHLPSIHISTLPTLVPPLRRTAPSPHSLPLARNWVQIDGTRHDFKRGILTHRIIHAGANTAMGTYLCISLQQLHCKDNCEYQLQH